MTKPSAKQRVTQRLLDLLYSQEPGVSLTNRDMAAMTGLSPNTVRVHMNILIEQELVNYGPDKPTSDPSCGRKMPGKSYYHIGRNLPAVEPIGPTEDWTVDEDEANKDAAATPFNPLNMTLGDMALAVLSIPQLTAEIQELRQEVRNLQQDVFLTHEMARTTNNLIGHLITEVVSLRAAIV